MVLFTEIQVKNKHTIDEIHQSSSKAEIFTDI